MLAFSYCYKCSLAHLTYKDYQKKKRWMLYVMVLEADLYVLQDMFTALSSFD